MAKKSKSKGGSKETSDRVSTIAAKGLRTGKLTPTEVRIVSASALSQDQTKGKRR